MNTHLDDQGCKSRFEAAKTILEQIRLFTDQVPYRRSPPVFLAGDFNSEPEQEAYSEMTSANSPMGDLQWMVPADQRYGDTNTFSGFDPKTIRRKRIDFIFLEKRNLSQGHGTEAEDGPPKKWWLVDEYAVLPNHFEERVYNSDHQAVIGDVSLV